MGFQKKLNTCRNVCVSFKKAIETENTNDMNLVTGVHSHRPPFGMLTS